MTSRIPTLCKKCGDIALGSHLCRRCAETENVISKDNLSSNAPVSEGKNSVAIFAIGFFFIISGIGFLLNSCEPEVNSRDYLGPDLGRDNPAYEGR